MDKKLNITHKNKSITIARNEGDISFNKDINNSIWISGNSNETHIDINVGSFDYNEFKLYHIFYNLIQRVMGKYILQDYIPYYNGLPIDFINIEEKAIIYHSDQDSTCYFKLKFNNGTITLSVIKQKDLDTPLIKNSVVISSHDSQYGNYYDELNLFFEQLYDYCISCPKEHENQKRLCK